MQKEIKLLQSMPNHKKCQNKYQINQEKKSKTIKINNQLRKSNIIDLNK